jgi:hypothetical protein
VGAGRFVAIVTDDVHRVGLSVGGAAYRVSLENNVAFAEFPVGGDSAEIVVTYADGSTERSTVRFDDSPPPALVERLKAAS